MTTPYRTIAVCDPLRRDYFRLAACLGALAALLAALMLRRRNHANQ